MLVFPQALVSVSVSDYQYQYQCHSVVKLCLCATCCLFDRWLRQMSLRECVGSIALLFAWASVIRDTTSAHTTFSHTTVTHPWWLLSPQTHLYEEVFLICMRVFWLNTHLYVGLRKIREFKQVIHVGFFLNLRVIKSSNTHYACIWVTSD